MTTIKELIQPHGILVDIANAIIDRDTSALERFRNKISNAVSNNDTAADTQKSILQFIDTMSNSIHQRIAADNQELEEAETKIGELNLQIEEFEKIEANREQRLEELKTNITDLIDNSLL